MKTCKSPPLGSTVAARSLRLAVSAPVEAMLIVSESFETYTAGQTLNTQGSAGDGWSGAWTATTQNWERAWVDDSDVMGAGNAVRAYTANNDAYHSSFNRGITATNLNVVYMSFLLRYDDVDFGLTDATDSDTLIRVNTSEMGRPFGISVGSTTGNLGAILREGTVTGPGATLQDGTTHQIVLRFEQVSSGWGQSRLDVWLDPGAESNTPVLTATGGSLTNESTVTINNFLATLHHSGSSSNAGTYFDELHIGTTWDSVNVIPEPGTLVLLSIALGSLLLFRRRSR